jgi:hypothetical protein
VIVDDLVDLAVIDMKPELWIVADVAVRFVGIADEEQLPTFVLLPLKRKVHVRLVLAAEAEVRAFVRFFSMLLEPVDNQPDWH